jgi:glycosyltransferase involved in cell wall biosynthesis
MKALFVMNGIGYVHGGKPGVAGGEIITIEIARRWMKQGVQICIATTRAGRDLCEKMGLDAIYYVHSGSSSTVIGIFRRLCEIFLSIWKDISAVRFDLVLSSSENLYDSLPAYLLRRRGLARVWAATAHFLSPLPSQRRQAGCIRSLLFYVNQTTGSKMLRSADLIFAVSERTARDYVKHAGCDRDRVLVIPGGVDFYEIRRISASVVEKKYDAVFMGRLDPMKGIYDLLEIWRKVVTTKKNARLLVIGGGSEQTVRQMLALVSKYDLGQNVDIIGPVYDIESKVRLLAASRVFILPSLEENWALVIGEALAANIPVIAYDLPKLKDVWNDHVNWVEKGDTARFANVILELICCSRSINVNADFLSQYDWGILAESALRRCLSLTRGEQIQQSNFDRSRH